jgi:hypothetical protein
VVTLGSGVIAKVVCPSGRNPDFAPGVCQGAPSRTTACVALDDLTVVEMPLAINPHGAMPEAN